MCDVTWCCCVVFVFFFKQKTAYEMRISDWGSDVCSSDLLLRRRAGTREGRLVAESSRAVDRAQQHLQEMDRPTGMETVGMGRDAAHGRSEEHTSEPQSLMRISYAVFCLKQKKTSPHQ